MAEYIEREAMKGHLRSYAGMFTDELGFVVSLEAVLNGIDFQPAADVVSRAAFNQVMWERDTAMEQLEEHGIPFGGGADVEPVKHSRWLQPKPGECFCSECKTNGSPQWKRCPICEAKMQGAVDE